MSISERKKPFYQIVDGICIPGCFDENIFRSGLSYQPKAGDLFTASYPKCGTTWTQTIVYLLCNEGKPAEDASEFFRMMPFLELYGMDALKSVENPFAIKVHLPFDRTPYSSEAKYIYVARNPKDAVISYFHHTRTTTYLFEDGEFDFFFDLFMDGKVDFGDFFDHVLSWYSRRQDKNVLFITFEELKSNTRNMVLKIAQFMGEKYVDMLEKNSGMVEDILRYSSMEEMKKIFNKHMDETAGDMSMTEEGIDALPLPLGLKHIRKFIIKHRRADSKHIQLVRNGIVGGWKNVLNEEQILRIERKMKEKFSGTELYEIWKNI